MPSYHPDPLGQCLLDYYGGNAEAAIVAHCIEANDYEMSGELMFRGFEEFSVCEQAALRACRGRVLDVGAGAGSHALWLQAQGLDVTALDTSAGAVDVMQARGVQRVLCADIFDFSTDAPFDTLLLMMNGIGLAGTLAGLDRLLDHARTLLADGGQVLFDTSDMKFMYELPMTVKWMDGKPLMERIFDLPRNHYYGEFSYQMSYRKKKGKPFRWVYVDIDTMREYAQRHGFAFEVIQEDSNAYSARLLR